MTVAYSIDEPTIPVSISLTDDSHDESSSSTAQDAPSSSSALPTVPQHLIETFRQDGFVVFPRVLSLRDVTALNQRLEEILRGRYDTGCAPDKTPRLLKNEYQIKTTTTSSSSSASDKAGTTKDAKHNTAKQKPKSLALGPLGFSGNRQNVKVLQVINVHKADRLFRRLAVSPVLGKIVAQLAGWTQGARLAQDQVWAKPPGAAPLTFHRDAPYFMFIPADVVTVWVALDDMTPDIGPLQYVKSSHLWGQGRVGSSNQFFEQNGGSTLLRSAARRQGFDDENDLTICSMAGLSAGGISIHDGRTWHGSSQNKSKDRPRRGLGLHFVPAQVHFTAEAAKSRLWGRYVQDQEDATLVELPEDDFPVTWKPST